MSVAQLHAAVPPAETTRFSEKRDLVLTLSGLTALLAGSFPVASLAVFQFGTDRVMTSHVLAGIYVFSMSLLMLTPWFPLPSLRQYTALQRTQLMVFIWFFVAYTVAVTWELPWLLLHRQIAEARDAIWAYPWWHMWMAAISAMPNPM